MLIIISLLCSSMLTIHAAASEKPDPRTLVAEYRISDWPNIAHVSAEWPKGALSGMPEGCMCIVSHSYFGHPQKVTNHLYNELLKIVPKHLSTSTPLSETLAAALTNTQMIFPAKQYPCYTVHTFLLAMRIGKQSLLVAAKHNESDTKTIFPFPKETSQWQEGATVQLTCWGQEYGSITILRDPK